MSQTTPDARAYYGYLFEPNKQPTKVLDALLRGIANYVTDFLGNKEDKFLTPAKLASFYKAVGGNYDSLFVDVPYSSISWIYASIGCQHTLQPTNDEFAPPSIPALTTKGFVRWQSIEILLGPEEHVPFIQNAVKNFAIKNPDNGEPFPVELPTEAFPLKPDVAIEKWHNQCAERLRQRSTPEEEVSPRPDLPPRPKVEPTFAHVRAPPTYQSRPRPEVSDYFEPKSRASQRPIPYQHVSSAGRPVRPGLSNSPTHRARQFLAPEAPDSPRLARSRRRSVPDNMSSPVSPIRAGEPEVEVPRTKEHARRHSHPRHARRGSVSSDASSEDEPSSPDATRRSSHANSREGKPSIRFEYPSPTSPPDPRFRRGTEDGLKRRSYPVPIDRSGKLSEQFLAGKRGSGSRTESVTWKDLTPDMWRRSGRSSEEDREKREVPSRRRRSRDDGYVDRDSGGSRSDHKRREKERDRERDMPSSRPKLAKRHSSYDDDYRWERDWERDHDRGPDIRSFRDRDRERRAVSPVRGVDGRYYPVAR